MLKYMLDTNIVIYTMKNRPTKVREVFNRHQGRMCISAITLGEMVFGAEHSQQVERNLTDIETMVARLEVLPFNNNALKTNILTKAIESHCLLPERNNNERRPF
jgi:tRNA(fMet)-specific endonuclease VapC